ncbi:hypothetical protein scyTo_0012864 [Scyliorhinus torazame]|uniref:Uncharacterized protein n=1 Tax=Scyliorhinus torazame TaxID=75743 RepID=A0A401NJU8_SCYTO|nr:hypothetical protein [Scyliorhinus torazame]
MRRTCEKQDDFLRTSTFERVLLSAMFKSLSMHCLVYNLFRAAILTRLSCLEQTLGQDPSGEASETPA